MASTSKGNTFLLHLKSLVIDIERVFLARCIPQKNELEKIFKKVDTICEALCKSKGEGLLDTETLAAQLYSWTKQRYSSGEVHIPEDQKLHVVWDLDECLIKSEFLGKELDPSLNTTVIERPGGPKGNTIVHVDDDLLKFRTRLRDWSRLVLVLLRPFTYQYVFTSATRGYMINIVSLIEGGYNRHSFCSTESGQKFDDSGEFIRKSGVNSVYEFFESPRISSSDFPQGHLRFHGKDVKGMILNAKNDKLKKNHSTFRAVLLDDQPGYHIAQPLHGIQINPPPKNLDEADEELIRKLPLLLQVLTCFTEEGDGTINETTMSIVSDAQSDDFWKYMLLHISMNFGVDCAIDKELSTVFGKSTVDEGICWGLLENHINCWAKEKGIISDEKTTLVPWQLKVRDRFQRLLLKKRKKLLRTCLAEFNRTQAQVEPIGN